MLTAYLRGIRTYLVSGDERLRFDISTVVCGDGESIRSRIPSDSTWVEGPLDNPTWVSDYKFGDARLRPARVNQICTGAGLGPNVPVTEVKP
jgi:hypothetical protein